MVQKRVSKILRGQKKLTENKILKDLWNFKNVKILITEISKPQIWFKKILIVLKFKIEFGKIHGGLKFKIEFRKIQNSSTRKFSSDRK